MRMEISGRENILLSRKTHHRKSSGINLLRKSSSQRTLTHAHTHTHTHKHTHTHTHTHARIHAYTYTVMIRKAFTHALLNTTPITAGLKIVFKVTIMTSLIFSVSCFASPLSRHYSHSHALSLPHTATPHYLSYSTHILALHSSYMYISYTIDFEYLQV